MRTGALEVRKGGREWVEAAILAASFLSCGEKLCADVPRTTVVDEVIVQQKFGYARGGIGR